MAGSILGRLSSELEEHSLWQVLGSYAIAAWIVAQGADTVSSLVGLPLWFGRFVVVLLLIGGLVLALTGLAQGLTRGRDRDARAGLAGVLSWRNALRAGLAAFLLLGASTVAFLVSRNTGVGPGASLISSGSLETGGSILVADLVAADRELGMSLSEALRVDLAPLGAVGTSQLAGALVRMGLAPGSPIDERVAREMAEREGFGAIVGGELSEIGGSRVIAVHVDGADGVRLLSLRETARDETRLIETLDRLSRRLRERIGESLRSVQSGPGLDAVTTPSLSALRRYTLGRRAMLNEGEMDRAAILLEEAIAEDTAFAMAYRLLGTLRGNQGNRSAEVAALTAAYSHRDRLTELERALTEATYHDDITSDRQRAIAAYQNVLAIDSTNLPALNNEGIIHMELRDFDAALASFRRAIAVEPDNIVPRVNMVEALAAVGDDAGIEATISEVESMLGSSGIGHEFRGLWLSANGEWDAAEEEFFALRAFVAEDAMYQRSIPVHLAALAAVRGRLAGAEEYLRAEGLYAREPLAAAMQRAGHLLHLAADTTRAIRTIEESIRAAPLAAMEPLDRPYLELAELFAMAGRAGEARRLRDEYEREIDEQLKEDAREVRLRVEGEIQVAEGRPEEAIASFRASDTGLCLVCALPPLARALDAVGRRDEAIAVYERYLSTPMLGRVLVDQFQLVPALERLASLHEAAGQTELASRRYRELAELLDGADPVLVPRREAALRKVVAP